MWTGLCGVVGGKEKDRTDPESLRWSSLHPHRLNDALRPAQTSNTHHRWRTCDYLPLHHQHYSLSKHHLPLWTSTHIHSCCLIQEPCSRERGGVRQMSQKHHGHTWPSTASPEAEHVKGYLCSSKAPPAFCTGFQATSNEIGSASQCSLSEQILRQPIESRGKKKKQKATGFHKAIRPSADSESCYCRGRQHVANIKETSKPEQTKDTLSFLVSFPFVFYPALHTVAQSRCVR